MKPSRAGKYPIIEKIATGGMGEIYRAKHPTLGRDIILKRLTMMGNRTIQERFRREARLMMDFRHEGIVQVYDHFREGPSYYIAMEFIQGRSLAELLAEKRYLPDDIALLIFHEVCRAVKYAHDKGVIHRDIKPENILISGDGAVKITDFGIATTEDASEECLTREMTLGTPAYMSPEQITCSRDVDVRADIYSLGVVLYQMVTGKCPYPGAMSPELINAIRKGRYVRPDKINPRTGSLARRVIRKAMHHNIRRRYRNLDRLLAVITKRVSVHGDAEAVKECIRTYISENRVRPKKKTSTGKAAPAARRSRWKTVAAVATVFLFAIFATAYLGISRGYHHEIYRSAEYGALCIEIRMPVDRHGYEPRYAMASLQKKEGAGYRPVDEGAPRLSAASENDPPDLLFHSRRLYVPAGEYRLTVDMDGRLYLRDFLLKSRKQQKKDLYGGIENLVINHTPGPALPAAFSFSVRDARNGTDITDEKDISILWNRRWVPWLDFQQKDYAPAFLTAGKKFFFRIQKKEYFPGYVQAMVERHQSSVSISTELVPVPGTLLVNGADGLRLLINHSLQYMKGGREGGVETLEPLTPRYQRIVLSPGNYIITAERDSRSGTETVDIRSGKYTRIYVSYNDSDKKIAFNIKE